MPKFVRIVAAILAILMGLSAIGMIAMYISAESYDAANSALRALTNVPICTLPIA